MVDKYKKYDDSSAGLLNWLNGSEDEGRKQQSEAIAADPQTLQKQLEDTKARQCKTRLESYFGLEIKPQIYLGLWSFISCIFIDIYVRPLK